MSAPTIKSYIRDQIETVSQQELKKLQLQRLILGVDRLSKRVPFYTEKRW